MNYFLSRRAVLKWLETPSVYHLAKDELYELDGDSLRFLQKCMDDAGAASRDSAFIDYCMDEGLLTAESAPVKRPAYAKAPEPSLRYLELQITDACNIKCKHCYIGDTPRQEISPRQVHGVLKEFEEMQGLRVMITGGEPLLHRKFEEINEMLPGFFIRKVLFTNGLLLKKDNLKGLKVDEIQISIDGLEHAHDALRGGGTYSRAMLSLRQALDAGFDVSVSTMVHRENLSDFDDLERMFKDLGVKDWSVDVPCFTGALKDHAEVLVTPQEGGKYLGYGFGGGLHSSGQGYGCGLHLAAVLASGKIAKCTFYQDDAVGSIELGLQTSWQKIHPVRLSELACKCEFLEICRGGCRYRAELIEGKDGRDRYRCKLYGILDK